MERNDVKFSKKSRNYSTSATGSQAIQHNTGGSAAIGLDRCVCVFVRYLCRGRKAPQLPCCFDEYKCIHTLQNMWKNLFSSVHNIAVRSFMMNSANRRNFEYFGHNENAVQQHSDPEITYKYLARVRIF